LIVITHVSFPTFHAVGVYINVLLLIVQLHKLPFVFTPLKLKFHVPQFHSSALDSATNCAHVMLLDTFPIFHVAKLFAVGATSLNVYIAVFTVWFPKLSLTYHVTVTLHGCLAAILVLVAVHQLHAPNLYALLASHTPPLSLALVILKLHAVHSAPFPLLNVNVGASLSIFTVLLCISSAFPNPSLL
jgi:hypothetical protein